MNLFSNRTNLIRWLSVAFLVLNCSWLFAPYLSNTLLVGPNLISEYEALNVPYSEWFRLFDVLASLCLLGGLAIYKNRLLKTYGRLTFGLLLCVPILLLIDEVTAVTCASNGNVCVASYTPVTIIHGAESLLLGMIIFFASWRVSIRHQKLRWMPVFILLNVAVGLTAHQLLPQYLFGLQTLYIIIQTYWLWRIVFEPAWQTSFERKTASRIHLLVAILATLSGVTTILTATLHYKINEVLGDVLLIDNTAWFDQHSVVVGLILLLIARNLLRGSRRAYNIAVFITLFELINVSGVEPLPIAILIYGLLLALLIVSRQTFDQQNSTARLIKRLGLVFASVAVIAVVVTISSVGFRVLNTEIWEKSAFTAGRVIQRTLLLEVSTNHSDPLKARIFGQVLTATGIFLYGWVLSGLFLPSLIERRGQYEKDRIIKKVERLLGSYSTNSEDYFKLWPNDKQYWLNDAGDACVAYKVNGSYAFVPGNPIASPADHEIVASEFNSFCREEGWQTVWLMTDHDYSSAYENSGLSSLTIGASAIVDIQGFANDTVRNKWWRWKRNKAIKSDLRYYRMEAPHNAETINSLRIVSNNWLKQEGRVERGFALGYFDEHTLRSQTIHCLRDINKNIVAFTNQLPTYNNNPRFTIDLMRFIPEYEQSMAFLLSEVICDAAQRQEYRTFDLGFVPLAHASSAGANLLKTILKPVFSTKGLRQFKNKFEPSWQTNYLAWGGTLLDLPAIATNLQRAMSIKND